MVKIFFITFFIAELIIALAIISKILRADRYVREFDCELLLGRSKLKIGFADFRLLLSDFTTGLTLLKETVKRKHDEYLFGLLKNTFVYSGIIFSKGKLRKAILTYQLGKEIYEGLIEAEG